MAAQTHNSRNKREKTSTVDSILVDLASVHCKKKRSLLLVPSTYFCESGQLIFAKKLRQLEILGFDPFNLCEMCEIVQSTQKYGFGQLVQYGDGFRTCSEHCPCTVPFVNPCVHAPIACGHCHDQSFTDNFPRLKLDGGRRTFVRVEGEFIILFLPYE